MRYLLVLLALAFVTNVQAQALRRTKVWIQNPTSNTLYYSHKAGGDDWRKATPLPSGGSWYFTGIDPHWVSFNNGKRKTVTYRLVGGSTNYFRWKNGTLDLIRR